LIEIDYNDKLTLIVDGLSYRSNGNFQFAYRIKGLNENWIKVPGEAEKIDFASLPTGDITIEIKLIDYAGQDSLNFIRYKLHVSPPFWQRWWFYVLITLSALILASGIFRIRLKALRRKQKKELKHLRLENELSLTQQSALKAQMNPHFLFNVLNSIKGYIYDNDKKNAAKYLNDFSILVRKVLEMSAYSHVSLKEELEVLELYIRLEAMLMNDDFEYNIIIDDNVDTDNIQIPALVIQPYIENAFKHGLRHKVGSKKLSLELSFLSKEEILSIRIYDNGIGREESRKINEKNSNKYSSFATNALKQRLNLLNQKKPDLVGVEIRDVTSEETNLSVGTEIIIRIHIYEKDESNID
jgi:LytS/YehU family sensor histidine kinase